jgi:SnoaL-like domain
MTVARDRASAFVEAYGRNWETWDIEGFVGLFDEGVVYVAHPTEETVVGRDALTRYLLEEKDAQGAVSVRMGEPVIDGDRVVAEFWVLATNEGEEASIAGCLIARLDARGRCTEFREYWFDIEGHAAPPTRWGA